MNQFNNQSYFKYRPVDGVDNQAFEISRKNAQQSKSISRTDDWIVRIVDSVSQQASTFENALNQLKLIYNQMSPESQEKRKVKLRQSENNYGEANINKSIEQEKRFANFKPNGKSASIKELIEKFISKEKTIYSEKPLSLEVSYLDCKNKIIKNSHDILKLTNLYELLEKLNEERSLSIIVPRNKIIIQSSQLIAELETQPLNKWAQIIFQHHETALDLIEENAKALEAAIVFNPNPQIGGTFSIGHKPREVATMLDKNPGSQEKLISQPMKETLLAALLSFIVRQGLENSGDHEVIKEFEQSGLPLLKANELKNMSLHGIKFYDQDKDQYDESLISFTYIVSYLLGLDPGLGDCRVCDLPKSIEKLPTKEKQPSFQQYIMHPNILKNLTDENKVGISEQDIHTRSNQVYQRLT